MTPAAFIAFGLLSSDIRLVLDFEWISKCRYSRWNSIYI